MKEREARGVKRSPQKNRTLLVLAVVGSAALIWVAFALDAPVCEWQLAPGKGAWRDFATACSRYGDWPPLAGAVLVVTLVAAYFKARRSMTVLVTMFAASLLAGAVVNPLRAVTGRARPNAKVEAGWYGPRLDGKWLVGKHAYSSFPSAHTTVAFAMAVPLFLAGWRAGAAGCLVAALIGWSRIYLGVHHPSDVMVGAMLGAACGWAPMRSAACRWWTWRAVSAACGLRRKWPRNCAVPRSA
jgi:undecaprenyl-diphosphatase